MLRSFNALLFLSRLIFSSCFIFFTLSVLHSFLISLFPSCNFQRVNFLHASFFLRCTFFVLHSFHVLLFQCCTFFVLQPFHVAFFSLVSCCALFMLLFFWSFRCFFRVVLFSYCTFFVLHSFYVALPFFRTDLLWKTSKLMPFFPGLCIKPGIQEQGTECGEHEE